MNFTWVDGLLLGGLLLLVFGFFFMQMRRRKSVMNEQVQMVDRLRPGMRVKTVAGVIGRIKEIREESSSLKTVLLETGNDKMTSFVLYDIQAVLSIVDEAGANVTISNVELTETPIDKSPTFEELEAKSKSDFDAKDFVEKSNKGRKK